MRSPHTIGDELPLPGTVTFQTAVDADHLSVYCPAGTLPWPEGPRQRGQYFAPSPATSIIRTSSLALSEADSGGGVGRVEGGAASNTVDTAKMHRLNHA